MRTIAAVTEIAASPPQVWEVLTDFPRYPEWAAYIRQIDGYAEKGSPLRVVIGPPDGPPYYDVRTRFVDATPGIRLAWLPVIPGVAWLPPAIFGGAHEFVLTALPNGGTRLVHREHFSGVLARLTTKGPRGADEGFEAFNTALKRRIEKSENSGDVRH
jgi:hypothetical protein